jgi:hypothetical protein
LQEPSCKIDWRFEGYRQVWLYDATHASRDELAVVCHEFAEALVHSATVPELTAVIQQVAARRGLRAEVHPGPSHADPARLYVTVGLFTAVASEEGEG